uniref:Uncharacterized protein n=1 Tax=Magnetococcus massalia (strain MO-1) TaxID=451514 RepID=A0A1S7LMG7_MAGMO|nr:Conserved protein of unknown function [Candidatus Magnetococcus massalia]
MSMSEGSSLIEVPAGRRRERDGSQRYWYRSAQMELFIWVMTQDKVMSFQWVYARVPCEQVIHWQGESLRHYGVDEGEQTPLRNDAPLFIGSDPFDWSMLCEHFQQATQEIRPSWQAQILQILRQENNHAP